MSAENRVEGKLLVVHNKTALPMRCFKTNAPVSEGEYRHWELTFIPQWLRLVMLCAPFFLVAVPFAARHRCHLRAGLSKSNALRVLLVKLLGSSLILVALLWPLLAALIGSAEWLCIGLMCIVPLLYGGLAILILFSSPLRVVRHKGELFWIKGCSAEFLRSLNSQ